MDARIGRSIDSMEKAFGQKSPPIWLYINKEEGCILTTEDKNRSSPMYEIADWVQFLTNHPTSSHPADELKRLHNAFQKLWEGYISELTLSR